MTRSSVQNRSGPVPRQRSLGKVAAYESPNRAGPMPDPDVVCQLARDGDLVRIPASLLFAGHPGVGVLTWCLLRLDFGSCAVSASYADFAGRLGMRRSAAAIDQLFCGVFASSIQPAWIRRDRGDGRFTYQAVLHHRSVAEDAVLGKSDLRLLDRDESVSQRVTCADLADFARWQTVCQPTGWTAESSEAVALRWGVSPNNVLRSKRRLVQLGLLEVTRRAARQADIVWITELLDPVEAERIEGLLSPTRRKRVQRKVSQQHVSADVVPLLDLLRSLPSSR